MAKALVDQIEDANRSFLAGTPSYLSEDGAPFAVVYCFDPRLTGLLEPALGLPRHRAMTIRIAGNRVSAENHDVLRSAAAAVYMRGAEEIIVVGHSDCAMAAFQTADVIDAFRRRKVSREAFGAADLRTWFGAIGNIRGNVAESVEFIRSCGIFPPGLPVAGFVIDTMTGKLDRIAVDEIALRQTEPVEHQAAPHRVETDVPPVTPPPAAVPPPIPRPVVIDGPPPAAKPIAPPDSLLTAARMLSSVIQRARGNPAFQRDMSDFRMVLHREKNPAHLISAVEALGRKHSAQFPELPALASFLRAAMSQRGPGQPDPFESIRRVLG
jgi:carbonic anhydrase